MNGDLHSDQVLWGADGWTVIDPVLLRGDIEYDLARVLWTRLDEVDGADLPRLVDIFVDAAGVPPERVRRRLLDAFA